MRIRIDQKNYEYAKGTPLQKIADDFQPQYENPIIVCKLNGALKELLHTVHEDAQMSFLTTADKEGYDIYKRSLIFLLTKAIHDLYGMDHHLQVLYAVGSGGYYCEFADGMKPDGESLARIRERMLALVEADKPITKRSVKTQKAKEIFEAYGWEDKAKLFRYRMASETHLYRIDDYEDYYYGYMASRTGILKYFDLCLYDEGFILQFPEQTSPCKVQPFVPENKLNAAIKESVRWSRLTHMNTVGDMNELISKGGLNEVVLVQEALQEKKIGDIAERIASSPSVRFVLIAGPSSSGKTSTANRLCIQLKAQGRRPRIISTDNYFVDRENTPLDEDGNQDFEVLEALDIPAFNRDLKKLMQGEAVELPTFNFVTGKREYQGNVLQMGPDDILVIEGIHCLNDKLTYDLPASSKFKIYVSALRQLNIDEHNRIPSTDGRLIRRIVRDARTRGYSAQETIERWPTVRRGEEKNIFPYQESADAVFNSALLYELAVLKQYCVPLLYAIPEDAPEYAEAKRLLKFFDYFVGFGSDHLPNNSLLREFVGGSCFQV